MPIVPIAYTESSYFSSLKSIVSLVTFLLNTIMLYTYLLPFWYQYVIPMDILTLADTTNPTSKATSMIPITLTCDDVSDFVYKSTQSDSFSSISEYLSARLFATDISLSSSESSSLSSFFKSFISSSLVDISEFSEIYVVPSSIIFFNSSAILLTTISSFVESSSSSSSPSAVFTSTLKLMPV